jgi:hypothetical protein
MTTQERLLAEAREIYASDPDRALELRRQVAAGDVSGAWSQALVDLAAHEHGQGNFEATAEHALKVLGAPAPSIDAGARAVAGILLASAHDALDREIDEAQLAASIEGALEAGHPYWAASGLTQLARLHRVRGERDASKRAWGRAADSFAGTDSMLGVPSALLHLATMEHEDGDDASARAHVERALAHLASFPHGGRSVHLLREKLVALKASLP